MRTYPTERSDGANLLGFAGFKVGGIEVLTVDDREKTPNFGKHLLNPSTVIAVPPIRIIGIRGYAYEAYVKRVIFDMLYGKDTVKYLSRKLKIKYSEEQFNKAESTLDSAAEIVVFGMCSPARDWHIPEKTIYF